MNNVESFVLGWDVGDFDTSDSETLGHLLERFPKTTTLYRGTKSLRIRPPLSWTTSVAALERYFSIVGVPGYEIPAYKSDGEVTGIDVSAVAQHLLDNGRIKGRVKVAAARLAKFDEVVTLSLPRVTRIGVLVEDHRTHAVKLTST